jgi:hypothetical protein
VVNDAPGGMETSASKATTEIVVTLTVLRKNAILIPLDVASPNDDNSEEQPPISEEPWR